MCDRSLIGHAIKTPVYGSSFGPQTLLNNFEGFRSTFPNIGTKLDAHSLFLSLMHRKNRHGSRTRLQTNACKNCPRHFIYVKLGNADSLNMVVLTSTGAWR